MANIKSNETENIDIAAYLTFKGFKLHTIKKSQKPYRKVFVFIDGKEGGEIQQAQIEYLNSDFRMFADNIAHFKNLIHLK